MVGLSQNTTEFYGSTVSEYYTVPWLGVSQNTTELVMRMAGCTRILQTTTMINKITSILTSKLIKLSVEINYSF